MRLIVFLWLLFFTLLIILILREIFNYIKLKKLEKTPLKKEIIEFLNKIPQYKQIPKYLKPTIHFKMQRFVNEKKFIGIKIEVDEKMKYIIAFFACLPTIAYKDFCYPSLEYIYIYPNTIIFNERDEINKKELSLIEGEATGDIVIIAWNDAKKEIFKNLNRNVIIHEFAHELDFEQGAINGIPPIDSNLYQEWSKIIFHEFKKFREKILKNRDLKKYKLIDKYAATNPAEFFAVLSEYYFTKPSILKKHFPNIYKELKKFYKIEIKDK